MWDRHELQQHFGPSRQHVAREEVKRPPCENVHGREDEQSEGAVDVPPVTRLALLQGAKGRRSLMRKDQAIQPRQRSTPTAVSVLTLYLRTRSAASSMLESYARWTLSACWSCALAVSSRLLTAPMRSTSDVRRARARRSDDVCERTACG